MYFEAERDYLDIPALSKPNKFNSCDAHFHKHIEILYVIEGMNTVTINGITTTLHANQFSIADSYDIHSYKSQGDLSICLIIPFSYLKRFIQIKNNQFLSTNFVTDECTAKKVKNLIDIAYEHWKNKNELIIKGLFTTILGIILDNIPLTNKSPQANKTLINNILHYIEQNLTKDLTISSVAEHFHYSKCYFSSLFNSAFHTNFNNYVNLSRCSHAIYLLKEKNYSIIQAAMESGFTSVPTFYRQFKKHFGLSPKHYIEAISAS